MDRRTVSSGTDWEPRVGYARAVRVGDRISVSGTTATGDGGEVVAAGQPYEQAKRAMENVVSAVKAAGGRAEDVVRTRMYVVDIDDWDEIGRAHAAVFGGVRPATTMIEVSRLIDAEHLVEVEAEAVVGSGTEPVDGAAPGEDQS